VTQISVECSNRNVETVVLGSSCCLLGHLQTLQVLGRAFDPCRILAYAFRLLLGTCCGACSRRGDLDAFDAGLRLLHNRMLLFLSFRVTCCAPQSHLLSSSDTPMGMKRTIWKAMKAIPLIFTQPNPLSSLTLFGSRCSSPSPSAAALSCPTPACACSRAASLPSQQRNSPMTKRIRTRHGPGFKRMMLSCVCTGETR